MKLKCVVHEKRVHVLDQGYVIHREDGKPCSDFHVTINDFVYTGYQIFQKTHQRVGSDEVLYRYHAPQEIEYARLLEEEADDAVLQRRASSAKKHGLADPSPGENLLKSIFGI